MEMMVEPGKEIVPGCRSLGASRRALLGGHGAQQIGAADDAAAAHDRNPLDAVPGQQPHDVAQIGILRAPP